MKYLILLLFHAGHLEIDRRTLRMSFGGPEPRSVRLLLHRDGHLVAQDIAPDGDGLAEPAVGDTLIGLVHFTRGADGSCYFLRTHPAVIVDGRAPPLSLMALDAGSTITVGERTWLVAHVWQPVPFDAPALVKDQLCPVCSGPLSLAPVVECYCGRMLHLQSVAPGESAVGALNCFLQSGRCSCGAEPTLSPQLLPERARHAVELQLAWGDDREGERHG